MTMYELLLPIVTAIVGGGVTWVFTIKYDRKQAAASARQAETAALQQLQIVYEKMIDDLNADRARLESEITAIKKEVAALEKRFVESERIKRALLMCSCDKAAECKDFKLRAFS